MSKKIDRTTGREEAEQDARNHNCGFVMVGHGKHVLVDKEDQEPLSKLNLHIDIKTNYVGVKLSTSSKMRVSLRLHQLLLPCLKGIEVDHKNGNKLDCRKQNLRPALRQENCANTARRSHNNSSRYKGVRPHWNKWVARGRVNGKEVHLGSFDTENEAAESYNRWAAATFGKFARLNAVTL